MCLLVRHVREGSGIPTTCALQACRDCWYWGYVFAVWVNSLLIQRQLVDSLLEQVRKFREQVVWLAINALGWQIPRPSPPDQQVWPREARREQSTLTRKGMLLLVDTYRQAPLSPEAYIQEGQDPRGPGPFSAPLPAASLILFRCTPYSSYSSSHQ